METLKYERQRPKPSKKAEKKKQLGENKLFRGSAKKEKLTSMEDKKISP